MVRILSLVAAAGLVVSASPSYAHARLVSATPSSGAVVSAPAAVSLTFNERFAVPFSSVEVRDDLGRPVTLRQEVSEDGKTLSGSFARPLPTGVYEVRWAVAAADGHRMTGSHSFTVR